MADVEVSTRLARMKPELPGCPRDVVVQAFMDVARDFCQRTRALQYIEESETIQPATPDYDILLPSNNVQPIAIESLKVDGVPSQFKTPAWLDANVSNWRDRDADDFQYFTQLAPLVITFACVPTVAGTTAGVHYRVSLKPTLTATAIDSVFLDEWEEALADGAKARLMAQPGKLWENQRRAERLEKAYRAARARAQIRVNRAYGEPDDRWVGPRFA